MPGLQRHALTPVVSNFMCQLNQVCPRIPLAYFVLLSPENSIWMAYNLYVFLMQASGFHLT